MSPRSSSISASRPVSSRTSRTAVSRESSPSSTIPFGNPHARSPRWVRRRRDRVLDEIGELRGAARGRLLELLRSQRALDAIAIRSSVRRDEHHDGTCLGLIDRDPPHLLGGELEDGSESLRSAKPAAY